MSARFLVEQFATWRNQYESLVLVTVLDTAGSTYSKTGRQLLINPDHDYAGLVGGGCLEGDLVLQADQVFGDARVRVVTYDMRDDADDLWGMGLGCRGMMKLMLQRLDAGNDWAPFSHIAAMMSRHTPTRMALTVADHGKLSAGQLADPDADQDSDLVCWTLRPWPRLLVLGAGPDAAPVIDIARTLGWHVSVADHRAELLSAPALVNADTRHLVHPETVDKDIDLNAADAVVVMSHHLQSDLHYLQALQTLSHTYVGVLGPAQRKQELLDQLKTDDSNFAARLRGPVGLNIGADSPQTIALALLSEIQSELAQQPPRHD
ncbi:MAG: XdhC family protein [Gammaproteobacteria bacterium]|nr:XdhC family protein [Gammaproteobacteria bacterium]NND55573.1 XdhC family protein [Gammaproteobacteria bacterium]